MSSSPTVSTTIGTFTEVVRDNKHSACAQVETEQVETEQVETEQVETEQVETEQVETEQVETDQVETEQVETDQDDIILVDDDDYDVYLTDSEFLEKIRSSPDEMVKKASEIYIRASAELKKLRESKHSDQSVSEIDIMRKFSQELTAGDKTICWNIATRLDSIYMSCHNCNLWWTPYNRPATNSVLDEKDSSALVQDARVICHGLMTMCVVPDTEELVSLARERLDLQNGELGVFKHWIVSDQEKQCRMQMRLQAVHDQIIFLSKQLPTLKD